MNKNTIYVLGILAALALGLGGGYFLFGGNSPKSSSADAPTHSSAEKTGTIYTCSMHPQVRQDEPGLCPLCEMDLIPLEETQSENPLLLEMSREAVRLANIRTLTLQKERTPPTLLVLNGKVEADERRRAVEVAHFPGRLEQLLVSFTGEEVRRGQKIALTYSPELITAQRELLEALRFRDINPRLVEAARNKLRFWKIPLETISRIEESGQIQEYFPLYAQHSGVLTELKVAVGDYLKTGQPLFTLNDLNRVWLLFEAYEDDLAAIEKGDSIVFTTPVLPGERLHARISFIDPVVNPETRVAQIRVDWPNPQGKLKPGMFVTGRLKAAAGGREKQLSVPASAVLWTGERSVVYVKQPGTSVPTYEYREVVLGERSGEEYLVKEGLESGEVVVVNGAFSLDAAAQLNNQQSMMNQRIAVGGKKSEAVAWAEELPQEFRQAMQEVINTYLQVKDALVQTDDQAAAQSTEPLLKSLEDTPENLLSGEARVYWRQKREQLRKHTLLLKSATEVEVQREQFEFLSNLLIEVVRTLNLYSGQLYVQHCPMAFDDAGADWLSSEPEILNPYFGDVMLRCGFVKDTLGLAQK